MPIRPDLRPFYKPPVWPAVRRRILERAGAKWGITGLCIEYARCEQCGVRDRNRVERGPQGTWREMVGLRPAWHKPDGRLVHRAIQRANATVFGWPTRIVRIVLTVAHLNHVAGDDRDENLKALCQWCHLHYDAEHHKQTRSERKDAARPLLVGGAQ